MTIRNMATSLVPQFAWRIYSIGSLVLSPPRFFRMLTQVDWYWETLESWTDWVNPRPRSALLEIGCNTGELALELAGKGCTVMGVDRSVAAIDSATKRLSNRNLTFKVGDACELPVGNSQFDYALAASLLNILDEPARLISEMARVTRSGGIISALFPTPNMDRRAVRSFIRQERLRGFAADVLALWEAKAPKLEVEAAIGLFHEMELTDLAIKEFQQGMVCGMVGRVKGYD